jgi:hypothetical protein
MFNLFQAGQGVRRRTDLQEQIAADIAVHDIGTRPLLRETSGRHRGGNGLYGGEMSALQKAMNETTFMVKLTNDEMALVMTWADCKGKFVPRVLQGLDDKLRTVWADKYRELESERITESDLMPNGGIY